MSPLCPNLYWLLVEVFGTVKIANEGESMVARSEMQAISGKKRLVISHSGEYYIVPCPFCGDGRNRLWIHHRWGDYPHLAICFNENCLAKPENRQRLRLAIFRGQRGPIRLSVERAQQMERLCPTTFPGQITPLQELSPDHFAYGYLTQRGFDAAELGRSFGLSYCTDASDVRVRPMIGRIYIPVLMRGLLVGFQGRLAHDPVPGLRVAKYWTMPGFAKRLALYNHDQALQYPWVVVVEGASDVWRVGPMAVAVLGHTISQPQRDLLIEGWGRRGTLVLLLDGDIALDEAVPAAQLNELRVGFANRIVTVTLPLDKDPGDFDQATIHNMIRETATAQGVSLISAPPA